MRHDIHIQQPGLGQPAQGRRDLRRLAINGNLESRAGGKQLRRWRISGNAGSGEKGQPLFDGKVIPCRA